MKINSARILTILAMLVVATFLVGCVALPAVAPTNPLAVYLVSLPDEARVLIETLVTAAVTWLLLQLSTAIGLDLSGYIQPFVAVISPFLITLLEYLLGMIPATYDSLVLAVIHLVVLLVSSLGVYGIFAKARAKKVHALLTA